MNLAEESLIHGENLISVQTSYWLIVFYLDTRKPPRILWIPGGFKTQKPPCGGFCFPELYVLSS